MAEGIISHEIEEWRTVADFPNYEVSNLGRIRRTRPSYTTNPTTGRRIEQFPIGYLIKPKMKGKNGYLYVSLRTIPNNPARNRHLHDLVCRAFHGAPPTSKHHVAHWDGIKSNCRAENLRWATQKENAADKKRHGTDPIGSRHGHAKLNENDVINLRLLANNISNKKLSEIFGISQATVSDILRRRKWKHI